MIPTLKTLPVASGQESKMSSSSQSQDSSGVGEDKKAFGEILNSQESHSKSAENTSKNHKAEKVQVEDSGNKGHKNGKELPASSEGDSSSDSSSTDFNSNTTSASKPSTGQASKKAGPSSQSSLVEAHLEDVIEQVAAFSSEVSSPKIPSSEMPLPKAPVITNLGEAPDGQQLVDKLNTPIVTDVSNTNTHKAMEAALNREVSTPVIADSSTRVPGTVPVVGQLLNEHAKKSENNISSQKSALSVTMSSASESLVPVSTVLAGDGGAVVKQTAQTDLLASSNVPVFANGKPGSVGNISGAANHIVSPDVPKYAASILPSDPLTPDDFAAIQQALGGGAAKEKALFESMEQLTKLDSPLLKPAVSSQVGASVQPALASQMPNGIPVSLESGLDSVAKSGNMTMASSLGDPSWDGELLGRVNILVKGGVQEAKIQLSPPDMGRLEIKISTEGDSTKVMFAVENVAARDAIEQAMPRLRELLEQGGLQLSHSEVADHSQSQKEQGQIDQNLLGDNSSSESEEEGENISTWQLGVSSPNSTVDYYI